MFLKRIRQSPITPAPVQDTEPERQIPTEDPAMDVAVESFSLLLREFGRMAFSTDQLTAIQARALFEKWATHILYGGPRPGDESVNRVPQSNTRDWISARYAFIQHRAAEYRQVNRSLDDLNKVIWSFVEGLKLSLEQGETVDNAVRRQITRLDGVVKIGSADVIRREVALTVTAIQTLLDERKNEQDREMQSLYSRIRELGAELEEVRQESARDPLTHLYNRSVIEASLERAVNLYAVFKRKSCLMLIDIDHFKVINDTYGHAAGDAALQQLANCITRVFPRKTDLVARYGGEEFAVILADAGLSEGRMLGSRLLNAVRDLSISYEDMEIKMTISVGMTETTSGECSTDWLKRTDQALYHAKNAGRDKLVEGNVTDSEQESDKLIA